MRLRSFSLTLSLIVVTGFAEGNEPEALTSPKTGAARAGVVLSEPSAAVDHGDTVILNGNAGCCGPRIRARAEYLLWWTKGADIPPLVTTSPPGTPIELAGVLGLPTTAVLFGGSEVNDDARSGGRLTIGAWLDDEQTIGIEGTFFILEQEAEEFAAFSTGVPILARPFFNMELGVSDSLLIAFPGVVSGAVDITATSEFYGGDLYVRKSLYCGCCCRVDALCGYRYLALKDDLALSETEIDVETGAAVSLTDRFRAENDFHGGEVGLIGEYRRGCWSIEVLGKVALGVTRKEVDINGVSFADGIAAAGGFLALPTNMGVHDDADIAFVSELGVTLGYQVTENVRALVGYTFIYWSDVARAGEQINLAINPSQVPPGPLVGVPAPTVLQESSDFWAHGLSLGLELRW